MALAIICTSQWSHYFQDYLFWWILVQEWQITNFAICTIPVVNSQPNYYKYCSIVESAVFILRVHCPQKVYEQYGLQIRHLRCEYFNHYEILLYKSAKWVLFERSCTALLIPENDYYWVHRDYVCLVVKDTDWVVSRHSKSCGFLIAFQRFTKVLKPTDRVNVTKSIV